MPAHKSCRIEYSFRWKRNYRHTYRNLSMRWKINKKINFFWFFKCKFETFIMVESTMCLRIKVAELNPLSDGKGITGISSAVF